MKPIRRPQDQVFWYLDRKPHQPCIQNQEADVVIVGGGMAGLSAAQAFAARGKKVIVLEQYYCGAGATGKSSGFITPNAELSLTDFSRRFSFDIAHQIWNFITSGVNDIRNNIATHSFDCDYFAQDSLMVATTKSAVKTLATEYENLQKIGFASSLYSAEELQTHIGSTKYFGAVRYKDTFGINPYRYCQELQKHLTTSGVIIFEETPVLSIKDHTLTTPHATINGKQIVLCTDRFAPNLHVLEGEVYHVQTFLMISQVLTDAQIHTLFPEKPYMVWDTNLVYSYLRLTGQKRLLLGGGNVWTTYAKNPMHNYTPMLRKLTTYLAQQFNCRDIEFEHMWPGLIGISKDIVPLAGRDAQKPYIYYIAASTGLPIAAALGRYSAEHLLDGRTDLDTYFSPYRSFPIGGITQKILGTRLSFALSNLKEMVFT